MKRMILRWLKSSWLFRNTTSLRLFAVTLSVFAIIYAWTVIDQTRVVPSTVTTTTTTAARGESQEALHADLVNEADVPRQPLIFKVKTVKQVVYKDFSQCPPKPTYLEEYKAHCWAVCIRGQQCTGQATQSDIEQGRAKRRCFSNLHLIGVRKSGTTDFTKWFTSHKEVYNTLQDYIPSDKCPVGDFHNRKNAKPNLNHHAFNDGPGVLIELRVLKDNDTHMEVVTPMQLLGYMSTPYTKFYVQLRNPAERTISYLFHMHKKHYILTDMKHYELTEPLVHSLITEQIASFKECVGSEGELACVYKYAGNGRRQSRIIENLLRHSLYVIYLEESFKFVPRQQFRFSTMDEYIADQVGSVKSVMEFFGLKFQNSNSDLQNIVKNVGKEKVFWNETIEILDEFFKPYNQRLADLLGDDKWLFKRGI